MIRFLQGDYEVKVVEKKSERVPKTGPGGVLVFGLDYCKMLLPPSTSRNMRIFCSVVCLLPFMIWVPFRA